jgi:hypothetical protein
MVSRGNCTEMNPGDTDAQHINIIEQAEIGRGDK